MPVIEISTWIWVPRERVFDLARSVEVHQESAVGTDERAVAGVTWGLLGLGDEVTWEARHWGVRQRLSVKVTRFDPPRHFRDELISGPFQSMVHDHFFEEREGGTEMVDRFEYRAPLSVLGRCVERMFLTAYLRRFLERRNKILKACAERGEEAIVGRAVLEKAREERKRTTAMESRDVRVCSRWSSWLMWICAGGPFLFLSTLVALAMHVWLGLGRWPRFGEDPATLLFRVHWIVVRGVGWFAVYGALPLWMVLVIRGPFRSEWRLRLVQLGVFGLGWLVLYGAGRWDPTPFTRWLLD